MTHPTDDIQDRLTAALRAEVDGVEPDAGSLDAIRRRGRAARGRRRAVVTGAGVVALIAVAVAVPTLGSSDGDVTTGTTGATTTEPPGVLTAPPPTDLDQALWPDPSGELFTDPVEAVRSFVEVVIGVDDPDLSEFQAGEPGAGEVSVARVGEDGRPSDSTGIASTVTVRQLDGVHWFVTSAGGHDVQIDSPEPLAAVSSPLTVTGQGLGYEGTIVAELRPRSDPGAVLDEEPTIAGASEVAPFSVELAYDAPGPSIGMLVARDDPGTDLGVPSFAAIPVRLGAGSPPAGSGEPSGPPTTTPTTTAPPAYEFGSQPLWPFRTQAEADAWLVSSAEGHSPWHASAEMTAQAFTTGYLGFGEIDLVTSEDVGDTEAWIGVGYEAEPGVISTSAVIHLVRFGPDPDAPWEVVGTRDTALTLDTPSYGSAVSSPVTVGGTVTGVDESLRVQVRQQSSEAPLGESCCLPAGGEGTPWESSVAFSGAADEALTIVVSTGGHVQDVEIFAITGVRGR
jgi:hypothetical protein